MIFMLVKMYKISLLNDFYNKILKDKLSKGMSTLRLHIYGQVQEFPVKENFKT